VSDIDEQKGKVAGARETDAARTTSAGIAVGVGQRLRRLRTFESFFEFPLFRWYMLSAVAHGSAMQMQMLVRGFLVFHLTGSFAALGALALAEALPRLLLGIIGGLIADQVSKRRVIQIGQLLNVVFSLVIAMLLVSGTLRFEHLLLATFVQATVNAFIMPSRMAMVPALVDARLLTNAIALNQGARNVMRLFAPAAAGALVAVIGAAAVYFMMVGLYLFAMIALFKVPPLGPAVPAAGGDGGVFTKALGDIADGLRYIIGNRVLVLLMVVHLGIGMFAMPYQRMLPGFVDQVLGGGADVLGILMTLTGLGALFGSLLVASMEPNRRGIKLVLSGGLFAFSLLLFSISTSMWFTVGLVIVIGVTQAIRASLNMALVQSNVADEYRGRVISIYMMEMGLISLGAFAMGLLAEVFGIQAVLAGAALGMLLIMLGITLLLPQYRRLD
jgi:MFS transporter, DHA1 family, staphyloferrin A biosynthesis exporter